MPFLALGARCHRLLLPKLHHTSSGAYRCPKSAALRMVASQALPTIKGVVFDMDGTLTVPVIDFILMRQRVGVPQGKDILDAINGWPEAERQRAYDVIADMERQALDDMAIMPGAFELCAFLDAQRLPRGLITRNVKSSIDFFHDRFSLSPFLPSISRECAFPYKPHPAALLHICQTWGVAASEVMMVGDSVKDDIVSGNRAGAVTVLLDYKAKDGHRAEAFEAAGEQRPHHIVSGLPELQELLATAYRLEAPLQSRDIIEEMA